MMGRGSGVPGGQHNGYAQGIGMEQLSGDTGYGGTPAGFEGMASPYVERAVLKHDGGGKYFAATVVLRIISLLLALISLSLIVSAKDTHVYSDYSATTTLNAKAMRTRASQYLVAIGAIVLFYEVVSVVLGYIASEQTSTYVGTLFTFVADQVLAYLMFSAATAAANEIAGARHGDGTERAGLTCSYSEWNSFCMKRESGAAMGFLAFGALALLALLTGHRFSRHLS